MNFGSAKVPGLFYVVAVIYLLYCYFFTPNFLITMPLVIFPVFIYKLFWISSQTNVLFWGMLLQWMLPSAQVIYCNFYSITLAEKMKDVPYGESAATATMLNVFGLYAFSLGIFLAVRGLRSRKIVSAIARYSPKMALYLYIGFSTLVIVLGKTIWAFPALVQFVFVFFYIKWGFFLVTVYLIHKYGQEYKWQLYAFIFFELLMGLSSFFAGQIVYIILFSGMATIYLRPKFSFRTALLGSSGLIVVASYLVIWTAIKKEYRDFVSRGQVTQSVQVSSGEARDKFIDLFLAVDGKQLQTGLEQLVSRIGYIQFFAACVDYVPRYMPHQDGDVYWSAVEHFAVPRFLNPDKKSLDDSDHTSKYTGFHLLNSKNATSFSLGYITDAYVDFGPYGMHLLLFVLGLLFGFCFRYLVINSPNDYWVTVLTGPFLIILNINGTDTKKVLGGLVLYMVVIFIVRKSLIRFVESYLGRGTR